VYAGGCAAEHVYGVCLRRPWLWKQLPREPSWLPVRCFLLNHAAAAAYAAVQAQTVIYTCNRCGAVTCSLECSTEHEAQPSCCHDSVYTVRGQQWVFKQ
jgi:hypothetical protein